MDSQGERENNQAKSKKKLTVFLVLIIIILIIIILLLLFKTLEYKNKKPFVSTGDVFEIDCDCDSDASTSNSNLTVTDSDIIWQEENQLKIFKNPVYQMEEMIAPGSTNEYHFVVKNETDCRMEYSLDFIEENDFQINMKYRLKKGEDYLQKSWVSIDELEDVVGQFDESEEDEYFLEWKWFESDNDTVIGSNIESSYHLSIDILGKQAI